MNSPSFRRVIRLLCVASAIWFGPALLCANARGQDHSATKSATEHAPGGAAGASESHGAAEHASAAHAEPNILEFKPELSLATLIVFGVLLGVLGRFAWGPLVKALDARERNQEETVARVEAARAESERLLAEHKAQLAKAAEEVSALLAQARKDAEGSAASIVAKAQREAEDSKVRAQRDIASARDQALSEIWSQTADLAVSVAGKLLDKQLGADDHRRLVESALEELPSAAANGRGSSRV